MRRHVTFSSESFNTTEPMVYFINDCCFGDDVARWLLEELRERGVSVAAEPDQEDFGWYISFEVEGQDYDFVITYRPADDGEQGVWIGTLERAVGLVATLLGGRKKGIQREAAELLHEILKSSPRVADVRWYTDEGMETESDPSPSPVERGTA